MGDGKHQHALFALGPLPDGGDNGARAILLPFLATRLMLGMPKIAVADDQTGKRLRQRHADYFNSLSRWA